MDSPRLSQAITVAAIVIFALVTAFALDAPHVALPKNPSKGVIVDLTGTPVPSDSSPARFLDWTFDELPAYLAISGRVDQITAVSDYRIRQAYGAGMDRL